MLAALLFKRIDIRSCNFFAEAFRLHKYQQEVELELTCLRYVTAGVEMNGIQSRKASNVEKPFAGCLGRMVNLFDLSTGVTGNRLLTDKPYLDGNVP